eukprot:281793-Chlamydomonas_euryale.AAC.1
MRGRRHWQRGNELRAGQHGRQRDRPPAGRVGCRTKRARRHHHGVQLRRRGGGAGGREGGRDVPSGRPRVPARPHAVHARGHGRRSGADAGALRGEGGWGGGGVRLPLC